MKKFLSIALAGVMAFSATFSNCELLANANENDWGYYEADIKAYDNMNGGISFDVPKRELEGSKIKITIEKESTKPSIVWRAIKTLGKVVLVGLACVTSCGAYRIYNNHISREKEIDGTGFWGKVDAKGAALMDSFNSFVDNTVSEKLFGESGIINGGINKFKSGFKGIKGRFTPKTDDQSRQNQNQVEDEEVEDEV